MPANDFAWWKSYSLTRPVELINVIVVFAPLFSKPVWEHVNLWLAGAILAPGQRTVTAALRMRRRSAGEALST